MSILNRYIGASIISSSLLVLLGLVSLDVVFTFIRELEFLKADYQVLEAFQYSVITAPRKFYEFVPVSLLVGSLVGLGLLANNSELIVMRAAGLSIGRIVRAVLLPALVFIIIAALVGEYVAPATERFARKQRAVAEGGGVALESKLGHWYRDGSEYIHVNSLAPDGKLHGITVFRVSNDGQLEKSMFAEYGSFADGIWQLERVKTTQLLPGKVEAGEAAIMVWRTGLDAGLLDLEVLKPEHLSLRDLVRFTKRLQAQGLDSEAYQLAFWQKILQPFVTLSMIMLAVSFIFGPLRSVTMGLRVLAGVVTGLTFKYLQEFFGHLSIVFEFSTLLASVLPVALCFLVALIILKRVS